MNDARTTGPTLVERAAAILRDELEHGALGNVVAASAGWSTQRRDLFGTGLNRRLRADLEGLLEPLLDLLAPPAHDRSWVPADAVQPRNVRREPDSLTAIPTLRASGSAGPGQVAEIHTRLRNDGTVAREIGLVCSDLVAEPGDRIGAECVRLRPVRIRLVPGEEVEIAIGLDVPADARPGLYHALLQAPDLAGLRALLTFPVG